MGIYDSQLIERMNNTLEHRGPDDAGLFRDADVALGHRRLSIIDLAGGHQPMETTDGSLVIVFNGEIYNFKELRDELVSKGVRFETLSDTEVLLRLYQQEGASSLKKLNGMFAFAIFDRKRRELFLARDRIGIKPLCYLELPGRLLFASDPKALLQYPDWSRDINPHAVRDYLALRYVPGQQSMFSAIQHLPPGHFMRYRDGNCEISRYWSLPSPGLGGHHSEQSNLEELEQLLERSVSRRLIADVKFGAYLSGGLDSGLIVALMSKISNTQVKTFSVGFDYEHDELSQAAATAELLGCDHQELMFSAQDISLLPELVYHSGEPLGDAINLPMYKLAREAKKEVTVILTGEGADEIFGGYLFHKVLWAAQIYHKLVPGPIRDWLVRPLLQACPPQLLNLAFQYPAYLGGRGKQKALDYLDVINTGDQDAGYRHLISLFDNRDMQTLFTPEFEAQLQAKSVLWTAPTDLLDPSFDQILRLQFGHWLPNNMLARADRMSMASGIEARVPFLDHELVEFAFSLPRNMKLNNLSGKYLLRKVAKRLLPKVTANRKKMPFYVPMENYFQDSNCIEMMNDLLGEQSVRRRGIFRPEAIAQLLGAIHHKEFILAKQVFSLMTLELWFRTFVDGENTAATGT